MKKQLFGIIGFGLALSVASATDGTWNSTTTGGAWATSSLWLNSILPADGGTATLRSSGTSLFAVTGGSGTIGRFNFNTNSADTGTLQLTGGSFTLVSPALFYTPYGFVETANTKFTSTGDVTIEGAGRMQFMNWTNDLSGRLIVRGNVRVTSDTALGPAPATLQADKIILDGGGLENCAPNYTFRIEPTRGVTLTANGGYLGVGYYNGAMDVAAPITGTGALGLNYENSPLTLSNPANDWTGGLVIGSAGPGANLDRGLRFLLGADEVIPDGAGKGPVLFSPFATWYNWTSLPNKTVRTILDATMNLNGHSETVNCISNGVRSLITDSVGGGSLTVGGDGSDSEFRGQLAANAKMVKQGSGKLSMIGAALDGTLDLRAGTLEIGGANLKSDGRVLLNGGSLEVAAPAGFYEWTTGTYSGYQYFPVRSSSGYQTGTTYVYKGKWYVADAGTYSFKKAFNGGTTFVLDGQTVLSQSDAATYTVVNGVAVAAGWHTIELTFVAGSTCNGSVALVNGLMYDPLNGAFSTSDEIARAKMFTDNNGPSIRAVGYPSCLNGTLALGADSTISVDADATPLVLCCNILTNTPGATLTVTTPDGSPLFFGSADSSKPAVLDGLVDAPNGLVLTNYVWVRSVPTASTTIAPQAELTLDVPGFATGDIVLDKYSERIVNADAVTGSITVNSGYSLRYDTMQYVNQALTNATDTERSYANNVILNGGSLYFDGAGTNHYTGNVSGSGAIKKVGNGTLFWESSGSSIPGVSIDIEGGTVRAPNEASLGGATIHTANGIFANVAGQDVSFLTTPFTVESGGISVDGVAATMEIDSVITELNWHDISKFGNGLLRLGGTTSNPNLGLHARGGVLELAKNGNAFAVNSIGDIDTGATVRLAGLSTNQVNSLVRLSGGTLDMNGHDEGVQYITSTAMGGTVINNGAAAATLTVGENNADSATTAAFKDGIAALNLVKVGTGSFDVRLDKLGNSGTTVKAGTFRVNPPSALSVRLLRFTVTASRPGTVVGGPNYYNTGFQMSEFRLTLDGTAVANPTGTAATAQYPTSGEIGARMTDGSVNSKWYTGNYGTPLYIDYGTNVTFNGYQWATANDAPGRDPYTWTLAAGGVSGGTTNWVVIDTQKTYTATATRNAWSGVFSVNTSVVGIFGESYAVSVEKAGTLALNGITMKMSNLTGNGAVKLENGSTLTLNNPTAFTGSFLGSGTVILNDATSAKPTFQVLSNGVTIRNNGIAETLGVTAGTRYLLGDIQDGTAKLGLACGGGSLYLSATNSTYTGTTVITGGEVIVSSGSLNTKYVRFTPLLNRGGSSSGDVQYSEFSLWINGVQVAWPSGTTATIPDGTGFNNWNEGPANIIDGSVDTKFYWQPSIIPITIVMPEGVSFDEYRWYTANDATWRDPVSWRVEASLDGVIWTVVDERTMQMVTTDRKALAAACKISVVGGTLNAISDSSVVTLAAPGTLSVRGAAETLGPLNGNGTLALNGATVSVNTAAADSAFSGAVTGTGTFTKTGAGTLAVSGAWSFSGTIIVEDGIFDVSGASLSGVTNIILRGGSIIGNASVSGNLVVTSEGGSYGASLSVGGTLTLSGAMTLDNRNVAYPLHRTCFTFASTDAASQAVFNSAGFSVSLPQSMNAFRRSDSTSMKLAIAFGGTVMTLR